jgi:6-phosphogluconolactonase
MNEVRRFGDAAAVFDAAAELIAEAAESAIAERGRFLLVLAGGGTPRGAYEQLARRFGDRLDWKRIHLFWGDERCVPPEDAVSNYGMAADSLLRHVRIPGANVHRIRGEESVQRAAALYEAELAAFFGAATPGALDAGDGFDLVLLWIGDDGHTASLFPDSPALRATGWATGAQAPSGAPVRDRVTLTFPAINSTRECVFLITGAGKQDAVRRALGPNTGTSGDVELPAAGVRARNRTIWLLDAGAAGDLGV